MRTPKADAQTDIEEVVHAAVAAAMSDVAALLIAYGREGVITDDIIAHVESEVVTTLKNSSASNLPLEQQAIALTRAIDEVTWLIAHAVARSRAAHRAE
jgi:hypothetical protein